MRSFVKHWSQNAPGQTEQLAMLHHILCSASARPVVGLFVFTGNWMGERNGLRLLEEKDAARDIINLQNITRRVRNCRRLPCFSMTIKGMNRGYLPILIMRGNVISLLCAVFLYTCMLLSVLGCLPEREPFHL